MDVYDDWIPEATYASCQQYLPEACVEVFLEHDDGALVARRTNEPAQGEWFWPGARLLKGEELEAAAHRVARSELGIRVELDGRLGVFSHFWDTSATPGVESRHTVNVVFRARPADASLGIQLDDQHDDHRFVNEPSATYHEYVNRYLRAAGYASGNSEALD